MSAHIKEANDRLEVAVRQLCEAQAAFDLHDLQLFYLPNLSMVYGHRDLQVLYQSRKRQKAYLQKSPDEASALSIEIITRDATGSEAHYFYDRFTGLTVVNNFKFFLTEVRYIASEERDLLRFRKATRSMIDGGRNRVLRPAGINRLAAELQKIHKQLQRV